MALPYDPEFHTAIAPMLAHPQPALPAGDVPSRRARLDALFTFLMSTIPPQPTITQTTLTITTPSGPLPIHVFTPTTLPPGPSPAILLAHPGGHVSLTSAILAPSTAKLAAQLQLPVYSVEYRLAPEHPFPADLDDCYAALSHLSTHAGDLNIDPARIILYGASAGGGLAAALALRARDQGLTPQPKGVVLVYPMLDDRVSSAAPGTEKALVWTLADQETGWGAYLGGKFRGEEVSTYAAPGRAKAGELEGLPPHWIDVGGLDLFAGESLRYAAGLVEAGTEVEMHLWKGVVHGFEVMAPEVAVTKRAEEGRVGFIRGLVG
ncbi:alpha/beta hydrolase domain-containing protein [Elsinoe ampelina]|uniref:Alpha/beta hydrolase domain-containing protein n=1 Tax=Elsinoe ampelina TaxID=302913 RepID=A0A6A6G2N5_9PEZI|nr:alpha/beta hydrolase domain-containing protein [Elsinoe ampelina]